MEISDLIVNPSFEGKPVEISRFTVLIGTLITRVKKGLKTTKPGGITFFPTFPKRRLTPTSP
jgi:hypothetical protein